MRSPNASKSWLTTTEHPTPQESPKIQNRFKQQVNLISSHQDTRWQPARLIEWEWIHIKPSDNIPYGKWKFDPLTWDLITLQIAGKRWCLITEEHPSGKYAKVFISNLNIYQWCYHEDGFGEILVCDLERDPCIAFISQSGTHITISHEQQCRTYQLKEEKIKPFHIENGEYFLWKNVGNYWQGENIYDRSQILVSIDSENTPKKVLPPKGVQFLELKGTTNLWRRLFKEEDTPPYILFAYEDYLKQWFGLLYWNMIHPLTQNGEYFPIYEHDEIYGWSGIIKRLIHKKNHGNIEVFISFDTKSSVVDPIPEICGYEYQWVGTEFRLSSIVSWNNIVNFMIHHTDMYRNAIGMRDGKSIYPLTYRGKPKFSWIKHIGNNLVVWEFPGWDKVMHIEPRGRLMDILLNERQVSAKYWKERGWVYITLPKILGMLFVELEWRRVKTHNSFPIHKSGEDEWWSYVEIYEISTQPIKYLQEERIVYTGEPILRKIYISQ